MKKLIIETGDYRGKVEFLITDIRYGMEGNRPIDIIIFGSEEILEAIGKFATVGNIRELEPCFESELEALIAGATHTCLCGRLPEFEILND